MSSKFIDLPPLRGVSSEDIDLSHLRGYERRKFWILARALE